MSWPSRLWGLLACSIRPRRRMVYKTWILTSNLRGQVIACTMAPTDWTMGHPQQAGCLGELRDVWYHVKIPEGSKFEDVERLVREERFAKAIEGVLDNISNGLSAPRWGSPEVHRLFKERMWICVCCRGFYNLSSKERQSWEVGPTIVVWVTNSTSPARPTFPSVYRFGFSVALTSRLFYDLLIIGLLCSDSFWVVTPYIWLFNRMTISAAAL